jgi:hypothetical protein
MNVPLERVMIGKILGTNAIFQNMEIIQLIVDRVMKEGET